MCQKCCVWFIVTRCNCYFNLEFIKTLKNKKKIVQHVSRKTLYLWMFSWTLLVWYGERNGKRFPNSFTSFFNYWHCLFLPLLPIIWFLSIWEYCGLLCFAASSIRRSLGVSLRDWVTTPGRAPNGNQTIQLKFQAQRLNPYSQTFNCCFILPWSHSSFFHVVFVCFLRFVL